jgi:Arc/MetJ-type ribon-helix-helix transcriptional regulator
MNIQEMSPELQRFVEELVRSGKFSSTTEVIEAGVSRLMIEEGGLELDEETWAAIDEAERQIERGEYRDFREVAAELRKKYLSK